LTHESAANVSVDPPGRLIATGTADRAHVRVWDARRNRLLREVALPIGSIAVFSPDGRWLATGTDGEDVQLWDVETWAEGHRFPADRNSPAAFSPNGKLIAVRARGDFLSGGRTLWLYRTDLSEFVAALADPAGDRVSWVGFSPDGRLLLAAGPDSPDVRVWDLPALLADLVSLRLVERGRWLDSGVLPEGQVAPARPVRSATVVGADLLDPVIQTRWAVAVATAAAWTRPDEAEAYVRRAAALSDLGFADAALNDLSRALQIRPDHAEAAYLRGLEHTRRRQWDAAVVDFTQAAERPDLAGLARFMRGKTLLQLNRVDEMMSEVDALIRDFPGDPQLYYLRALGHSYRGRSRAAIADLEVALKLGPNHDLALNNLAWQLSAGPVELRDPKRALALARHAVTIAPEKATYRNTLGVVLYRLAQYAEAADALSQSVAAGKGQFDGYNYCFLSMCAARCRQPELARDYLLRAREWRRKTTLTAHEAAELDRFEDEAEKTAAEAPPAGRS
jgi:tetratricopeptide (TPR) repeat protein